MEGRVEAMEKEMGAMRDIMLEIKESLMKLHNQRSEMMGRGKPVEGQPKSIGSMQGNEGTGGSVSTIECDGGRLTCFQQLHLPPLTRDGPIAWNFQRERTPPSIGKSAHEKLSNLQ